MARCDFCDAEIKHPRGREGIEGGWMVMEIRVRAGGVRVGKTEKRTIVACPDHRKEGTLETEKFFDQIQVTAVLERAV